MEIINKPFLNWSPSFRKRLYSLSLRGRSGMNSMVIDGKCDSFVIIDEGKIIGWALYKLEPGIYCQGSFMLYVRVRHRRKGLGEKLVARAIKKYGSIYIFAWDYNSACFWRDQIKNGNFNFSSKGFRVD